MVAVEEALGEFAHCGAQFGGFALEPVGSPGGVGTDLGWIVGNVGGAAALGLARVGLDELAAEVDTHQIAVHFDLHLQSWPVEVVEHGVEGIQAPFGRGGADVDEVVEIGALVEALSA